MLRDYSALQRKPLSFSLEDSRYIIAAALNNFDPLLGSRAKDIFAAGFNTGTAPVELWSDAERYRADANVRDRDAAHMKTLQQGARWRLEEVAAGQGFMMRCRPAQTPTSEHGDPANPHPYAVIDYQFDGSLHGVIYMAHEVGHAIGDDCLRALGGTYTPSKMDEVQAYFVQLTVYDHLCRSPNQRIAKAFRRHRADTIAAASGDRREALQTAQSIFEAAQDQKERRSIVDTLMGVYGLKTVQEILAVSCPTLSLAKPVPVYQSPNI